MLFSDVQTHELYVEDPNSENCPPLFGAICCRLAALPYCCEDPVMTGTLFIQRLSSKDSKESANTVVDFHNGKQVFASLMDWKLSIWNTKEQKESARKPVINIAITRDTCVLEEDNAKVTVTNEASTWCLLFGTEDKENMVGRIRY